MKLFAVIPVKPFTEGKSRLKDVLSDEARHDLNLHMFEHVFNIAATMIGATNTIIVSADQTALELAHKCGAPAVLEKTRTGLNPALKVGAKTAGERGADAVMILPTDLPTVSQDDITALVEYAQLSPFVIIAPDRLDQGTNALLISPPDAIAFSFGPNSFSTHIKAAHACHIEPTIVRRDGLAFDIDTPEDFQQLTKQGWDAMRP